MRGCVDCGSLLTKSLVDHPYRYDSRAPIQLRSIARHSCGCGYYEIAIPRMNLLHEAISQALNVLRVKRDAMSFIFEEGKLGVKDGAWGVIIRSSA